MSGKSSKESRQLDSAPAMGEPVPDEFTQLLVHDANSDSESEEEFSFMEFETVHQEEDGSLIPIENYTLDTANSDDEAEVQEVWVEEFEVQENAACLDMSRTTHHLSPPAALGPGSGDCKSRPSASSSRRGIVGAATRRGGRAGPGRVRNVPQTRRTNETGWIRGQPLVERFPVDEELPQQVSIEIGRLTADRERRARKMQERRAVVGEADIEEEVFHDCLDFDWKPMGDWRGTKETFLPERTGPNRVYTDAYDAFRTIWDDKILSHIVTETNRYAQGVRSETFRREWVDTTIDEILVLFAFWMMLGIIRMPTIRSCFSTEPIMRTDIFRHLFSEKRYWNLNRAFHLANGTRDTNDPGNVLYPMGPILDHLDSKFREVYTPKQDICIDESLTLWKGPLKFMQYIRTKAARFGIKSFELCESATGYVWSFFVYTGRHKSTSEANTEPHTLLSSVSFVKKLIRPILNLGYVLFMDNWFNSPQLARYLKRRGTDCVGTLRNNRGPAVTQMAPLAEGQFVARQCGDVAVMALHDRKRLSLISTYHNAAQVQKEAKSGRPAQYRLQLIDDYNRGMGGVDRMDSMLEPYLVERKQCKKWTIKLFKRYLNKSIQNARILVEESAHKKLDALAFRMSLVQSISDKHRHPGRRHTMPRKPQPKRLTERHFIRRIPVTEEMKARIVHRQNWGRSHCVWCRECGRGTVKTVYHCPDCEVALCFDRGCFELYHTVAEPGPEHMA